MTFIHTADWHLGNQMHEIDRGEEARAFLRFLKDCIVKKNAEALVIAGDVFDTTNPSIEARKLYYSFLASLVDSCCKNVIVIAGNHDSAAMLDSAKELLDVLHIHVVGSINNTSYADLCFELTDASGAVCGICMAVPFVREVELRNLIADSSETASDCDLYALAYKKLYALVFSEAEKLRAGRPLPVIATGHLYAADLEGRLSQKKSNEKSDDGMKVLDVLGTLGNVPPSVFPDVDYVALGHVHYSTTVAKNPRVCYSGSPFVMGFDEAERPHFVHVVKTGERQKGKKFAIEVETCETPKTFRYKRISGTLSQIKEQLETLDEKSPLYIELCYKREIGVNAQEYLSDTIRSLPKNMSVVSWKVMDAEHYFSISSEYAQFDSTEIKNLDDKEIFTQLLLLKTGFSAESNEGKAVLEKFLPLFLRMSDV
ncbi:MAG: exonuclease subunit SbcD [Treponema sp.]|nr:exonuclease subunit SbcD [Treponema sp.]